MSKKKHASKLKNSTTVDRNLNSNKPNSQSELIVQKQKEIIEKLTKQLEEKQQELLQIQQELVGIQSQKNSNELPVDVQSLQNEIKDIKSSLSYRLGFGLTKPVRFFADGGVKNTFSKTNKTDGDGLAEDFTVSVDQANINEEILQVEGWAIAKSGVRKIEIFAKGESLGEAECHMARPDVAAAMPGKNAENSGFSFEYPWDDFTKPILEIHFTNKNGKTIVKEVQAKFAPKQYAHLLEALNQFGTKKTSNSWSQLKISKPIDLIIPVYNGYQYLKPLFDSIKKNTQTPYRLIVINDKSPDEKVLPYLKERQQDFEDFTLIENEQNLGFVQSVNKGVKLAQNHFVLVNTDVEVPQNWLARLIEPIIDRPDEVASVTPFTNAGTICSFPKFLKDNPIFGGMSLEAVDQVFQSVKGKQNNIEIPTGIGFCMAFNKELVDEIGMFDAKTFGKGYGEENDWCMRAIKEGYKNTIASNLFVYHKHGGSFDKKEKEQLNLKNSKKLSAKHPEYIELVSNYCTVDPSKKIRDFVSFLLTEQGNTGKKIFVIDHNIGGGTNIYRNEYIEKKLAEGHSLVVLQHHGADPNLFIEYFYGKETIGFALQDVREVVKLIENYYQPDEIFLNNLVSYPKPLDILAMVEKIKSQFDSRLILPLHDYYAICPSYNLLNDKFNFCGVPDKIHECKNCLKKVDYIPITDRDIEEWREKWGKFLELSDEILCFSVTSQELLLKAYADPAIRAKTVHIPHQVHGMTKANVKKTQKLFTIGLLGGIGPTKGSQILKSMLNKMHFVGIEHTKIVVVGSVGDSFVQPYKNFVHTGPYTRADLVDLVEEHEIDIFLIPSVWPETFSYTSEEIMKMGLPLAVFDIGAPAERVKKYDKGLIIEKVDGGLALEKLWDWFVKQNPQNDFVYRHTKPIILVSVDMANRVHDKIALWGWTYSPYGIDRIKLFIKGQHIADAFYNYPRYDLLDPFDQFEEMVDTGFFFNGIDETVDNVDGPASFFELEIIDKKGNSLIVESRFAGTPYNQYQCMYNLPLDSQYDIMMAMDAQKPPLQLKGNTKSDTLFSLIVFADSNFNLAAFTDSLKSIKKQTYTNWEIILCLPAYQKEEAQNVIDFVFEKDEQKTHIKSIWGLNTFRQAINNYSDYINQTKGELVAFVNANDELEQQALMQTILFFNDNPDAEFAYTDEDKISVEGARVKAYFKTVFNIDLLYSYDYINNSFFAKRTLLESVNWLKDDVKSACFYDLTLRLVENKTKIWHLPKVLHHHRAFGNINEENKQQEQNFYGEKALKEHFKRQNINVEIKPGLKNNTHRVKYKIEDPKLVSIIIPFRDQVDMLKDCVESILSKTDYTNYEILLISNNSEEEGTFEYLEAVSNANKNVQYYKYDVPFNYSKINNWAVKQSKGEYILFLNNDTEVIADEWLSAMVEHIQRDEVGGVGGRLLYDQDSLQHDGVIYGICDVAEHAFRTYPCDDNSRHPDMGLIRNVSICTAACLLTKRSLVDDIGGFDETNLTIAYNDVDFCMEICKRGFLIVLTPYALLYHYESKSRGLEDTSEKYKRFLKEQAFMKNKWKKELEQGDPFYSPNLSRMYNDYSFNI